MTVATAPSTAAAATLPSSSQDTMDHAVRQLQATKRAWTEVSVRDRIQILEELTTSFLAVADRWAEACIQGENIEPGHPSSAEEALVGPYMVIRTFRLLKRSLWDIEVHGRPRIPGSVRTRPDGQVVARIFPTDVWDQIFYTGV
ncbi:MAG TPA: hypothetical protein VE078_02360, partial [Thermoanaerobaculia bacterium]|nr:hypothetical protein [Thermoanaerobaculia bacterium]